jgi:predicted nucleic acid-binding protein
MILVDTSVWIDHLRKGDLALRKLLETGRVLSHPFIIGELAMGSLKQRDVVLSALEDLPKATVAHEDEVLRFIASRALFGLGIGYVDAHLLAAAQITPGTLLWTRDKRLHETAAKLSLAAVLRGE